MYYASMRWSVSIYTTISWSSLRGVMSVVSPPGALGAGGMIRSGEGCASGPGRAGPVKKPASRVRPQIGGDPECMGDSVRRCVRKRSEGKRWRKLSVGSDEPGLDVDERRDKVGQR